MNKHLTKRIYTRYFSQNISLSILGLILWCLSYTPLAEVHLQYAINQNLIFTFRYLSIISFLVALRGNYPVLKALHKTASVFIGIVPTAFFCMASILILVAPIFSYIMAEISSGLMPHQPTTFSFKDSIEVIGFWVVSASVTAGIWLLIIRNIFAQYKAPYDLDENSNYATVATLLMFFGMLGAHRFFVGKTITGTLYFCTLGFLGIGVLADGLRLILHKFTDSEGNII
ncbi:MAG: TM2 domain-containing protein [Lentisphaeraceae bacterium]|nr:TM2 domain-containing protein [Lentisphaeraceae bacterium]